MVFHWSLSDSKSPQVSRTLLRILTYLSKASVWMVLTRPLISKSSRPFNNPLVIIPSAPITSSITVTFILHCFFQFSCKVQVHILVFVFVLLYSVVSWDSKLHNSAIFFFLPIIIRSGCLAKIK